MNAFNDVPVLPCVCVMVHAEFKVVGQNSSCMHVQCRCRCVCVLNQCRCSWLVIIKDEEDTAAVTLNCHHTSRSHGATDIWSSPGEDKYCNFLLADKDSQLKRLIITMAPKHSSCEIRPDFIPIKSIKHRIIIKLVAKMEANLRDESTKSN